MSFSGDVKNELAENLPKARHCRIAELAALIGMCGAVVEGRPVFRSENPIVVGRATLLTRKLFGVELGQADEDECGKILETVKAVYVNEDNADEPYYRISNIVIQQQCCRRAFLRGTFLAGGSLSDPDKMYHFEISVPNKSQAEQLTDVISSFGIEAKTIQRKRYYVVYVKESEQIVDLLNIMEAHVALMDLENIRILKDMRNAVNRRVNCEAANINKTVMAASKQIEDINYLRDTIGLDKLSEELAETARLRIAYPEASLLELGKLHGVPIGKSGVNHRLKKLSGIAEKMQSSV